MKAYDFLQKLRSELPDWEIRCLTISSVKALEYEYGEYLLISESQRCRLSLVYLHGDWLLSRDEVRLRIRVRDKLEEIKQIRNSTVILSF